MLPQLLAASAHTQGETALDEAENVGDDEMWIGQNFAQFKLSGQKARYEHVMGLDVLLTTYNMYVLNASVLRI